MHLHVNYIYRHPDAGISITRLFKQVIKIIEKSVEVSATVMPKHDPSIKGILRNIVHTYRHCNRQGINHITGDIHYVSLGLIGCKSVVTVHDTNYTDAMTNPLKKWAFEMLYYRIAFFFTDRIVCISEHTRQSIRRFTSRRDIAIIPQSYDADLYRYVPKPFDSNCPNILVIGTAWNKNVPFQIRALNGLHCHFTIIGKLTPEICQALQDTHADYSNLYHISDEETCLCYQQCDLLLFCTLCEGFGLPPVEAQATGRPVVTSAIEPVLEVCGGAALHVDPQNAQAIRQAVQNIIDDESLRTRLVQDGLKNAGRFLPERTAQAYLQLYQSMADK